MDKPHFKNVSSPRKKTPLRTRRRFRLSFINENTFNEIWTIKLTQRKVVALTLLLIVAFGSMIAMLIAFTPLRTLLPGYLKQSQRQEYVVNSMRVDSMLTQLRITEAYASNLKNILLDSVLYDKGNAHTENNVALDSLHPASESERQFVMQYDKSNRYNVNVPSAIAPDGLSLHNPLPSGSISSYPRKNTEIRLNAPDKSPVMSMHSGTIISAYHSSSDGNTITVQHSDGLTSTYSGLATLFADKGMKVASGQSLGLMARNPKGESNPLTIELWYKGEQLDPLDFLQWH